MSTSVVVSDRNFAAPVSHALSCAMAVKLTFWEKTSPAASGRLTVYPDAPVAMASRAPASLGLLLENRRYLQEKQ